MGLMGWAGALTQPIRAYVLATGRQTVMVRAMTVAAVLNVGFAVLFIPRYDALGAAWSNGLTQVLALLLMSWFVAVRLPFRLNWRDLARVLGAAVLMAGLVAGVTRQMAPVVALLCGPPLGVAAYVVLLRLMRAVHPEDRSGLVMIADRLPAPARILASHVLRFVLPAH